MQHIGSIEIPMTQELQEFFVYRYRNQPGKLVDEFVKYLNTQKEAHEINKALRESKAGKTNDISKLLNAL